MYAVMKCTFLLLFFYSIVLSMYAQSVKPSGSFREDFSDSTLSYFRYGSTGNRSDFKWKSDTASAIEPRTKILLFRIDPADSAGAGIGPEIISNQITHFGSYSARLKVPHVAGVQPNTGAVVGYFTYNMDSLYGLSEIDFEWLVANPSIVYIGTWTGFEGHLKRIGRTINLATGTIYNTIYKEGYAGEGTPLTGVQNEPDSVPAIPGYDASLQFYTYGFDWHSDRLTWWMLNPATGKKMTLWDYSGSQTGIPQHPSYYRLNFWHTNNWAVETNKNAVEKPLHPYPLEVDWMLYQPLKR